MRRNKLAMTVAAAAVVAGCAATPDDGQVGQRILPDTRIVAEHFQQALAQHGPYRFAEAATPTWAAASAAEPAAASAGRPSFWARLWPAAAPAPAPTAPVPVAAGWAVPLPGIVTVPPASATVSAARAGPPAAKRFSLWEHFWPPLASAEPAREKAAAPPPRPAADRPADSTAAKGSGLSEVRTGLLKHAIAFGHRAKEQGVDGNVEALFRSPSWLGWAYAPRPHLGLTANASRRATDFLYGGLTWEWMFRDAFFVDLGLGISVHDGMLDNSMIEGKARADRREFGCRALFREYLELGYRFLDRHSLSLMWAHHSHGSLCSEENEGIDNAGLRYGLRM